MGLAYSFRSVVHYPDSSDHGGMQAYTIAGCSTPGSAGNRKRKSLVLVWALETSPPHHPTTLLPSEIFPPTRLYLLFCCCWCFVCWFIFCFVLELTLYMRLASNSKRFSCLCLQGLELKVHTYTSIKTKP